MYASEPVSQVAFGLAKGGGGGDGGVGEGGDGLGGEGDGGAGRKVIVGSSRYRTCGDMGKPCLGATRSPYGLLTMRLCLRSRASEDSTQRHSGALAHRDIGREVQIEDDRHCRATSGVQCKAGVA